MWVFDLDAFGAGPVLCAHLFHTLTPYALDRPLTHSRRVVNGACWQTFSAIRCPIPSPRW